MGKQQTPLQACKVLEFYSSFRGFEAEVIEKALMQPPLKHSSPHPKNRIKGIKVWAIYSYVLAS